MSNSEMIREGLVNQFKRDIDTKIEALLRELRNLYETENEADRTGHYSNAVQAVGYINGRISDIINVAR